MLSLVGGVALAALLLGVPRRAAQPAHEQTLRQLYALEPPRRIRPSHTALLLVDFQREFFDGGLPLPNGDRAAFSARLLLNWARRRGVAVVHVHNEVSRPASPVFAAGSRGAAGLPLLAPIAGEPLLIKRTGGAFTGTDLDARLKERDIDTVVIAGLTTHLAVAVSASDASELGYRVIVAADATATRDLPGVAGSPGVDHTTLQAATLAALADRFADVTTTQSVLDLPRGIDGG